MGRGIAPILAFDTSGPHCSAALLRDGEIVLSRHLAMARGQAEALMPLLGEVLDEAGLDWSDLGGLGVGVGPGNFTGIRISVAAARGLALAADLPAIGVSMFQVLRRSAPGPETDLLSLAAPRGLAYVQPLRAGKLGGARMIDPEAPPPLAEIGADGIAHVTGFAARRLGTTFGTGWREAVPAEIAPAIAREAAALLSGGEVQPRPAPLYIRPADAAPPADPPPAILP
ncbi:tRNA (adenosine(37)-N6)-threonylcarbamoyltransferase complex dimerization subunit type 1 TsaB [Rhodovulum sulfidophilum]|uniref:tRNA (adenosine(37)-N6)-threonylcarbamoyltransferase complex dimerization subunit type 1 TsaB n=1 Tax=Rhodovulum sulfidophilum TaxID=35806 RepID=UPI00192196F2|nr:tRNA (adenosine(37)-N6)-threonylcarbamoyltransferase complex dimerization subunit type 1 TsaB [Rhodovulum sulfidophilum]MBL3595939.1 tRNA (adenosine(37)-N6)-threonylcarbamoyltransferase complex dimerization subunit type 1 TsaB [Rhodovulum sulfidophilum]